MDRIRIRGGHPLKGEIPISGAKNAALKLMAASLLTAEKVTLGRIPKVRDIRTMEKLLAHTGASVQHKNGHVIVEATELTRPEAGRSPLAPHPLRSSQQHPQPLVGPPLRRDGLRRPRNGGARLDVGHRRLLAR